MRPIRSRLTRLCLAVLALGVVAVVAAPPSHAAPTLEVAATSGLRTGQTITVTGSGFTPNLRGIAVGQCRIGYEGPADCNLAGGATFRNADANGEIAPVTIKLAETFGDVDCTQVQCLIAAAPLPTSSGPDEVAANTVEVPIAFGDAPPPATAASAAPVAARAPVAGRASDRTAVPARAAAVALSAGGGSGTEDGDGLLKILIATNVALAAAGIYLGTRGRWRFAR